MFDFAFPTQTPLRQAITDAYRRDEIEAVQDMLQRAQMSDEERRAASELARRLVTQVRASRTKASGVDALMHEFSLSSEEGIALMCLAEALLRIPDNATRDRLIADKISEGNWKSHLNNSPSLFVNAAAWGLADYRQTDRAERQADGFGSEPPRQQRRRAPDPPRRELRHALVGQAVCYRTNH